jgi:ABC-type glycerol-3-phosphate transport system substrate-binding protein
MAQEKITLKWLEWWDPEYGTEVMDDLTAQFEAESGIKVERTAVPWGNMFELLVANARSDTADYDVLGMEISWLTGIDRLGGIAPLDGYLAADPAFANSLTGATPIKWLGETKMLNWYIFPYSYSYNVAAFENAGLEAPKSWDEVISVSKKFAEKTGKKGLGTYYNESASGYMLYYMFGSRLAQAGGKWFDDNGKVAFNSPQGVKAFEWWKKVYDSGILPAGVFAGSQGTVREQFATEKVAAMWDGPFAGTIAKQTNPDMKVAYAPAWCDVTCGYQWAGSGLAVAANSKNKDAAMKFVKFLLSEKISTRMTKNVGIPFATKAGIDMLKDTDDPILKQIPQMMNGDPSNNIFLEPTPETQKLRREFTHQFVAFVRGEKSAKEALDATAAVWSQAIDAVK